jgi:hypothetical protein
VQAKKEYGGLEVILHSFVFSELLRHYANGITSMSKKKWKEYAESLVEQVIKPIKMVILLQ